MTLGSTSAWRVDDVHGESVRNEVVGPATSPIGRRQEAGAGLSASMNHYHWERVTQVRGYLVLHEYLARHGVRVVAVPATDIEAALVGQYERPSGFVCIPAWVVPVFCHVAVRNARQRRYACPVVARPRTLSIVIKDRAFFDADPDEYSAGFDKTGCVVVTTHILRRGGYSPH
ncbi:hypothetical protein ACFTZB_29465 [Rhodococcus sp. NPDC057014]|uniref:hypothetical protein n=1 Tax=Rhodococcus sp. NPDC057014 TaxID=3346000 RepID=UPI003639AE19